LEPKRKLTSQRKRKLMKKAKVMGKVLKGLARLLGSQAHLQRERAKVDRV